MKLTNGHFREQFGEFGGRYFDGEFLDMGSERNARLEELIQVPEFEEELRKEVSDHVQIKADRFTYKNRNYISVSGYGKVYAIVGQILLAHKLGLDTVNMGTRSAYCAKLAAGYASAKGMKINICLSAKLSQNKKLVEDLKKVNANVDDSKCQAVFDIPEIFAFGNVMTNPNSFMIYDGANASNYPSPDLVGKLSSLYLKDLEGTVDLDQIDSFLVTIEEGTDAVGLYEYLTEKGIERQIITCEKAICQEYHNGESLITRAADPQEAYTTICPELAYLWRMGKVIRLGCDSYRILNTGKVCDRLNDDDARTVILADECMGRSTKNVLLIGGAYDQA